MMKTILPLLTIAASISADRLGTSQHEGLEEVGDQIEHFPRELVYAERRMEVVGEEMDEVEEQIKQYSPDLDLPEVSVCAGAFVVDGRRTFTVCLNPTPTLSPLFTVARSLLLR